MEHHFRSLTVVLGASLFLSYASIGLAQSKCDAGKLKEYGKKVFCLAKVDSKAAKKGEPIDTARQQKCIDKFTLKCGKAEERGDCTLAVKSCAALADEAEVCRGAANEEPTPTPTDTPTGTPTETPTGTPTPGPVCCESLDIGIGGSRCGNALDAATCTANGGVPGDPGTVCDFDTDACVTPPPPSTGCCAVGGQCYTTQTYCSGPFGIGGTFYGTLVCTPTGCAML